MPRTDYASNVFINCPFDDAYELIRNALIFAIFDCGFLPRSALEEDDAGMVRVEKIQRIIAECKFGIHDISRTEPAARVIACIEDPMVISKILKPLQEKSPLDSGIRIAHPRAPPQASLFG